MSGLRIERIGPACTLQDRGRPGYLDRGLSRSGAADPLALAEGAALLRQSADLAALEMGGLGGVFTAQTDVTVALTGAQMQADLDGVALAWNASHALQAGQRLTIGAVRQGVYGYLHIGGGFSVSPLLGSRSSHLTAGLGAALQAGDVLPAGADRPPEAGQCIDVADRFSGGTVRVLRGFQTHLFPDAVLDRFRDTVFKRGQRANRMGVEMTFDGAGFTARGQLDILSEIIIPGDIQMTGEGRPFVLLPECQTTGGYPRIGSVLPCDMPRVVQAPAGAQIRFSFVDMEEALAAEAKETAARAALARTIRPLFRDIAEISDLLSYQLVGGAISAQADMEDWG